MFNFFDFFMSNPEKLTQLAQIDPSPVEAAVDQILTQNATPPFLPQDQQLSWSNLFLPQQQSSGVESGRTNPMPLDMMKTLIAMMPREQEPPRPPAAVAPQRSPQIQLAALQQPEQMRRPVARPTLAQLLSGRG